MRAQVTSPGNGAELLDLLDSLQSVDPGYPLPPVIDVLADPQNRHLLRYVADDPFGAHVFPGNVTDFTPSQFLDALDGELECSGPIHLWAYIPVCAYRCRFCQYPVVLARPSDAASTAARWADLNTAEAASWLARVPNLRTVPIGEFNVFGGTPSLLAPVDIAQLLQFYRKNFNFTSQTTLRFEGDPVSLTPDIMRCLLDEGCTKVSCGVQSFDDSVLSMAGRRHSARAARQFLENARDFGFERISIDLMYGLLDQSVASVERDLSIVLESEPTGVVCTKLHLRPYADTRTGVSGMRPAAWQSGQLRRRLVADGHCWPTLGQQYQMRAVLDDGLRGHGYVEHPTMYYSHSGHGPERWKSLMVDQDNQRAEVAIGLGGSSSCSRGEAISIVDPHDYVRSVGRGDIPLASATGFDGPGQEARAVKMALTSCAPLEDDRHRQRFPTRSLFCSPWEEKFRRLCQRGLVAIDDIRQRVSLTEAGMTLVEAIINTEL